MTDNPSLEAALRRLGTALARLEDAAESRAASEASAPAAAREADPASDAGHEQLVQALDASEARAERLDAANRDVARRVDEAVTAIQSVLDGAGGGRPAMDKSAADRSGGEG